MRSNDFKLSLKNISGNDKEKISTDVLCGFKSCFLNGVDLSTKEGKKKYIDDIIAGKNPFQNPEDVILNSENKDVDITTPWTDIEKLSDEDDRTVKANLNYKKPFENLLLNAAYDKKMEEIQMETALPSEEISSRMLREYANNKSAQKNMSSAVKFFHNLSLSIFTDCDHCGGENNPDWTVCQHCGFSSDGTHSKKK